MEESADVNGSAEPTNHSSHPTFLNNLAPPVRRRGAPHQYKYLARCDQVCSHCHALFWLDERIMGSPRDAPRNTIGVSNVHADRINIFVGLTPFLVRQILLLLTRS